jgi:hypothetical protein
MSKGQNRYGRYSQHQLHGDKRTSPLRGSLDDDGKFYRCWNCGATCDKDREMLGEYTGSVPTSNLSLLLHMDGNNLGTTFTDSSPYAHTITVTGVDTRTAYYKFGTASAYFLSISSEYLSVADSPAFDFSSGYWEIDFWYYNLGYTAFTESLYSHRTDANNYFLIYLQRASSTSIRFGLSIYASGVETVSLVTRYIYIPSGTAWKHFCFNEYLNDYRIYVDGKLEVQTDDSSRPADYTGTVYLGTSYHTGSMSNYFLGYLDEYKVSKHCSHRDKSFDVPVVAYDEDEHIDGAYSANVTNGCWNCGCTDYR